MRIKVLEQRIKELEAANAQLQQDSQARQEEQQAVAAFKERLAQQLALRESELRQTETILSVLEASPRGTPAAAQQVPAAPAANRRPVTVFQINDEEQFLVLALESATEAAPIGPVLLLETAESDPLATVQLTQRDRVGFAIATILKRMDRRRPIQKGDALFLRPLG